MRYRQYLAALKTENHVLVLQVLHWADEIRDPQRELGAGRALIDAKQAHETGGRQGLQQGLRVSSCLGLWPGRGGLGVAGSRHRGLRARRSCRPSSPC
ncbi:hypothetical protein [Saccharopolyspora shandongensis]|uniref:hypothetical protein n=1 Tax=Saccharopolyspora shandongensis TaxID=418495 RepID=UPI0033D8F606